MRVAGQKAVTSADPTAGLPILILAGTPEEQRVKFEQALASAQIAPINAAVLGHRLSAVRAVLGRAKDSQSQARGNRLAAASAVLKDGSASVSERLAAIMGVERLILSLVSWEGTEGSIGSARQLEILGRKPDWLRQVAARMISTLQTCSSRDEFGVTARTYLRRALAGLPRPVVPLGPQIKKPDTDHWGVLTANPTDYPALRHGTIHSAKGKEYDAVSLALPKTGPHVGLDDWEAGVNSEPRRVLYVGASRARLLLAFGAGSQATRIADLLRADDVAVLVS